MNLYNKTCETYSPQKVIKVNRSTPPIALHNIIMIEGCSNYSIIQTQTGAVVCTKSLKFFEEHINDNRFIRTHKSHIVNLRYLSEYKFENGIYTLFLKTGKAIEVARRRNDYVRAKVRHCRLNY